MTEYIANRLLVLSGGSPYLFAYDRSDLSLLPPVTALLDNLGGRGVGKVVVSPDGSMMAVTLTGTPSVVLMDHAGALLRTFPVGSGPDITQDVAFSPDGTLLAIAYTASPYLKVVNVADGSPAFVPSAYIPTAAGCVAFSPDGAYLAVGHEATERLSVWNTGDWSKSAVRGSIDRPNGFPRSLAFSPDGSQLAVVHLNAPTLTVYSTVPSPTLWPQIAGLDTTGIFSGQGVAYSPDSARLAYGCSPNDGADFRCVRVYDTATWARLSPDTLTLSKGMRGVAWSPDGGEIAAVTGQATSADWLALFDASTYERKPNPVDYLSYWGYSVAYGPAITPVVPPFWTNKIKTTEVV